MGGRCDIGVIYFYECSGWDSDTVSVGGALLSGMIQDALVFNYNNNNNNNNGVVCMSNHLRKWFD